MKFNFFKTLKEGHFINFYMANYTNKVGESKDYEIVTRRKAKEASDIFDKKADAVTIIAYNKDNTKILLQKEFRLTINDYVWSFPAGLIDNGESPVESATRELHEETGLKVIDIIRTMPPCFTSAGLTNEMIVPVYCHAEGDILPSDSPMEEIEAKWFSKEEIKKLILENEEKYKSNEHYIAFTNRVSTELYHWCNII